MKNFVLTLAFICLAGCTYTSTKPKAIGYLIIEEIADSEKVLVKIESIAMELLYENSYSQDLPIGNNGIVLKAREYQSADLSFTFFFNTFHGQKCIFFGIYSDLPEDLVNQELELFKAEILKVEHSLVTTTENCGGLENTPSIFDRK
ncbi:hypothetical protein ISG33_08495 [Glaciecola sp. MH2013]|uniref:hypothetical protein n=1 Tax=Glaciecola sp. MH2013 TaxID=2785524 RepID=UPI00189D8CDD|nr:hypothetical protein [Glaciecola sp. MH2013]MBF7073431.1 hypothetical protein [Glaciecola sp. MH2013]